MNNRLSHYREQTGDTQQSLAEIVGVTSDYISIIERGKQTPGFKLAKRIADYFSNKLDIVVTVDDIFFSSPSNKTFGDSIAS